MADLYHFNINHDPNTGQFTFSKFRNPAREAARIEKKDTRWAKRNYDKLYKKAYKPIQKEMKAYTRNELNPKYASQLMSGKISKSYMNEYNRKLAELMNENISSLPTAPSGRVVNFIAKRGDIGVHMALADSGYDMSRFKSGVYSSGKVAYRQETVNRA